MKTSRILLAAVIVFIAIISFSCSEAGIDARPMILKFDEPAVKWKESLPIGNGRLGTMVAGNVFSDTLVINEETVWSGGPEDYTNPEAYEHLDEIRALILAKKFDEALAVGDKYMIGKPRNLQKFQPLGNLIFEFQHEGEVSDYLRTLSLDKALVNVSYLVGEARFEREIFASHPDDVMVIRLSTDNKDGLNFEVRHTSDHLSSCETLADRIKLSGKGEKNRGIEGVIEFESQLVVVEGKENMHATEDGFVISGAKEVVLHYTAATNYVNYEDVSADEVAKCESILSQSAEKSYSALKKAHIEDYSELFDRVKVKLGDEEVSDKYTDELIEDARNGASHLYLDELFYQMGRYLIIAGSREGTQPLNLQGIWNNDMSPPWDCKWTLNINLPMNYWMVETSNLSECHEPLFNLVEDIHVTGQNTAWEHYRCRGFVAHHNTDLWRATAPVDGANWGLWTFGGAWLTRHLWEHYLYTQDEAFLKNAFPIMKDASLFFFDFLSDGHDGYLATSPTVSFEQSYVLPDGRPGRLCEGPTMDNQILRDLFTNCYRAAKLVGADEAYMDSLMYFKGKLRPNTRNEERGDIYEWAWPAQQKNVSGQVAPLWGVHPGYEINYAETPEMAAAAEQTIRLRDPHVVSYETSGSWMSGTRANFWTRLYRGDDAYGIYQKTIEENLFQNVLVSFYPKKYFMIDGNLGLAAAMNEMLVQSQRVTEEGVTIVDLLPAMPKAWASGEVSGLRLRGGFEIDIKWEEGKLLEVRLEAKAGNTCVLKYGDWEEIIELERGEEVLKQVKDDGVLR